MTQTGDEVVAGREGHKARGKGLGRAEQSRAWQRLGLGPAWREGSMPGDLSDGETKKSLTH